MGIKDRVETHKKNIRAKILDAALHLGKESGWNTVSMRKIADIIEYSPPVIYEYFENKEDLLRELTKQGFIQLAQRVKQAGSNQSEPTLILPDMWLAYWEFATEEKELYQIMFGIEFTCCDFKKTLPEANLFVSYIQDLIHLILKKKGGNSMEIKYYYYVFWSFIHGLISINLIRDDIPKKVSEKIFSSTIAAIMLQLGRA